MSEVQAMLHKQAQSFFATLPPAMRNTLMSVSGVPKTGTFDYDAYYKQFMHPLTYSTSSYDTHSRIKSISKPRQLFQDIMTFTLGESALTEYKPGDYYKTLERDVPCSDDLKWWISYFPAGDQDSKNHLGVYLHVNKPVLATFNFKVVGSSIEFLATRDFLQAEGWGSRKFTSHDALRPLFVDGRLSITCQVEFEISGTSAVMAPRIGQCCEHVPADVDLVVGSERLKVHKSLLSLVSPVFHAMLTNDTAEAPSGEVEITEFDYGTVKTAVDFCYGRALENTSAETIVGTLRFADKYRINIREQLEQVALFNMKPESFAAALQYADESSKDSLFNRCCDFFKRNTSDVTVTNSFVALSPTLIARLLKQTFNLKTDLEVLRTADKNGIKYVLDELENPVIDALSVETFCETCKYAWDCSRYYIQSECGVFFTANKEEILILKEFTALSPNVTHGVLKSASYYLRIKRDTELL